MPTQTNPISERVDALVSRVERTGRQAADELRTRGRRVADRTKNAGRQVWLAGLGVVANATERTEATIDELAARGEATGRPRVERLTAPVRTAGERLGTFGQKVEDRVETQVATTLERLGVPSRREVTTLIDQVEALNEKIARLTAKA